MRKVLSFLSKTGTQDRVPRRVGQELLSLPSYAPLVSREGEAVAMVTHSGSHLPLQDCV
jgi:hypothetical protein